MLAIILLALIPVPSELRAENTVLKDLVSSNFIEPIHTLQRCVLTHHSPLYSPPCFLKRINASHLQYLHNLYNFQIVYFSKKYVN